MEAFTDTLVAISRHFGVLERDTVCCGDVTVPQCVALQRLHGSTTAVSTLADYLGKSPSATTRLVDGLEKRSWVERLPDPDDRRRLQLVLTDAGEAKARELRSATEEIAVQLLDEIPERRQAEVVDALSLLEEAIAKCRIQCCGGFDAGSQSSFDGPSGAE